MSDGFVSQGICPKCGSEELSYDQPKGGDESMAYPFTCTDCGFSGKEWYSMEYIETTEVK